KAPEVGVEVRAAATDDARIGQRVAPIALRRLLGWIIAESLRTHRRIVGDAGQLPDFQFIVVEVTRRKAWPLLHQHHRVAGLGKLARNDAARGSRTYNDEIHGLTGLEFFVCHVGIPLVGGFRPCRAWCRDRLRIPDSPCRSSRTVASTHAGLRSPAASSPPSRSCRRTWVKR